MTKKLSILCLLLSIIGFMALSVNASEDSVFFNYVNPAYDEYTDGFEHLQYSVQNSAEDIEYYDKISEVGDVLLQGMLSRDEAITVGYRSFVQQDDIVYEIYNSAINHTGLPNAGDYLRYTTGGVNVSISITTKGDEYFYTITYIPVYYTTAEQEAEMDRTVADVLSQLNLDGKDEFEKISSIYSFICSNVTYDYKNLDDDTYKTKYTAYAALIDGTAVCQGYANLFYRLALETGLDARIITGIGNGGDHAWNIVKIGDLYYNIDATWDSELETYKYFLKCNANFLSHTRNDEMNTEAFNTQYPMSSEDYKLSYVEGICGDNLRWRLDTDGVLTISGTGDMYDYGYYKEGDLSGFWRYNTPWSSYGKLRKIVIEEGVTSIGGAAFYEETELEEIVFHNNSIEKIGMHAFQGIVLNNGITLPDSLKTIEKRAFDSAVLHGEIAFGDNLDTISDNAFLECNFTGDLIIPDSVKNIGFAAFAFCGFDGALTIGSGLERINDRVFCNCKFKGTLLIPDTVTDVGNSSFAECSGIDKIILGEEINSIGDKCFYNCVSLKSVYYKGKPPVTISKSAFYCLDENSVLYLPDDLIFYYPVGKEGWTTPTWNGYKTIPVTTDISEPEPILITGDVNNDGELDIRDATLLKRNITDPANNPIDYELSIDFNKDGVITIVDAAVLYWFSMLPELYPLP